MGATRFPGWLSLPDAAMKYRVRYETLRRLARDGVFTVGNFSAAKKRPPVYLRVDELDAWKRGGVPAVERVRGEGG
jgi:hypothetical protein